MALARPRLNSWDRRACLSGVGSSIPPTIMIAACGFSFPIAPIIFSGVALDGNFTSRKCLPLGRVVISDEVTLFVPISTVSSCNWYKHLVVTGNFNDVLPKWCYAQPSMFFLFHDRTLWLWLLILSLIKCRVLELHQASTCVYPLSLDMGRKQVFLSWGLGKGVISAD